MMKMKKIFVTAMIAAFVLVATACGRNNTTNKNNNASTDVQQTTAATTAVPMTTEAVRESGGVLQDMVDGVENGLDTGMDMMDNPIDGTHYDNLNSATSGET